MRARKLDTLKRKGQIARAALDLLGRDGLESLSIAAVAEKVGIVPSAVYRHFASKDAILDAILDLLNTFFKDIVTDSRNQYPDPLGRLCEIIRRHAKFLTENQGLPAIVAAEIIFGEQPKRKARFHKVFTAYLEDIETIIREGQAGGLIRPDVSPRAASLLLLGIDAPAAALWKASDGAYDMLAHVEEALPIYLAGISVRPQTDGSKGSSS
ncbi:MAG: TetR/AcrR family transcriptional regulator [Deltaproteobacteria bacterium]|nr:TetR/AcrR family transcriptional regulator [Deltaproteobacteria bacterium]